MEPLIHGLAAGLGCGLHSVRTDLNLLRTLAVVLRLRHVTAAADYLGMTQPAVSRALARLRRQCGDPLLIRANGEMQLTHYAQSIAGSLGEWLDGVPSLERAMPLVPAELKRRFRIATTDFGMMSVVEPALDRVMAQASGVDLEMVPLTRDSQRLLLGGEIDLIVAGGGVDPTQMHERILFCEDDVCIMPASHPWLATQAAREGRLGLDDYLSCSHIGVALAHEGKDVVEVQIGALGLSRRVVLMLPHFHLGPAMMRQRPLVLTLPRRLARAMYGTMVKAEDYRIVEAPGEFGFFTYRAFWSERSRRDSALVWLVDQFAQATA